MTDRLDAYAEVILDAGLQFENGQILGIDALPEHAPLAHALAEHAYRRGARYVDVWYFEPHAKASRVRHAERESLAWTPPWLDRRYENLAAAGGALISVRGDPRPALLSGLDGARAGLDRMPALASRIRAQIDARLAWTIVCYPTAEWARLVYGEPDVEALWRDLERFLRLDRPDPVAAWRERMAELRRHADRLTGLGLDALRFAGPGTDLTIGLIPGARWLTSEQAARTGQHTIVNLPTEEVYTTPDRTRAEGVVTSTRPLALDGVVVEDLRLTFAGGRIVDVAASRGAEAVRAQLAADEGAPSLGEVALVDNSSPIGRSGRTYLTTLLDENAACHLAWGAGIPNVLPGWLDSTSEQLRDRGVNQAVLHTDFMVGGPEVTVTGRLGDGTWIDVLRGEAWQTRGGAS
ncbi:aminopeptidase [Nonomuraea candida]|uniref:aminopeptidase n=1 Tax=Nonomuraea candida TaxID=359159 RepID=UPI0005B87A48|nr:aminopeptidase [Nonomuraea candida]